MLTPNQCRFDYGKNLQPPPGFDFDAAIATSYSLDLNALLAIPIALCFKDTLEGDLKGEKIALFEALGQLKGKLKVFYQQGNIHLPREFNRLFALLEPFLAPIVPRASDNDDAFCSFHPKFWLLRYRNSEDKEDVRYRLLVLTRNLTFDRSWDLAAAIEGVMTSESQQSHPGLLKFLSSLSPHAKGLDFLPDMLSELPNVRWHCPEGFYNLRMLPGGGAHIENKKQRFKRPIDFSSKVNDLLVVSPFLGAEALDWLAEQAHGSLYLFSRAEELNAIGEKRLVNWRCYSLNKEIVDGEEKLEQSNALSQDLHAKLIVSQNGKTSHWHLGSANASSPALGEKNNSVPRNSEFMLRLTGTNDNVGPLVLLQEFTANDNSGLFVKHQFEAVEIDSEAISPIIIRRLVHQLISADWSLHAQCQEDGHYSLSLDIDGNLSVPKELTVKIGLLCRIGFEEDLSESMAWTGLDLTHISALIPVKIIDSEGEIVERLVVQGQLTIEGGDNRDTVVLRQLIDSPSKFFDYIRLLLQHEPDKDYWLAMEERGKGNGKGIGGLNWDIPIFEQLMLAAARYPEQLKRIDQLLARLEDLDSSVPKEFTDLWRHFSPRLRGEL
ncbi:MAG: phospholipase D family protein [Desulfocapsaceae bacterium]|nr:phospholipase D family protein [Desulfocapsaceae bacterium]